MKASDLEYSILETATRLSLPCCMMAYDQAQLYINSLKKRYRISERASLQFLDGIGYKIEHVDLNALIAALPGGKVFLLTKEDSRTGVVIFQCKADLRRVLGEMHLFEFIISDEQQGFIAGENFHDIIIVDGLAKSWFG